jgi:hypothetical protein
LAGEAARLGFLFQALGYFGRCSLDATLVGEEVDSAVLHWIECNGRWGATSLPMTLANRLVGDWRMRPFITVHRASSPAFVQDFTAVLERLRPRLYRPRQSASGVIFLMPCGYEDSPGLDFMVLAETVTAAVAKAEAVTTLLTNHSPAASHPMTAKE